MPRFISYPSSKAFNPFVKLLNNSLKTFGWEEEMSINLWLSPLKAFRYRKAIQIIHFHWPETFWRSNILLIAISRGIAFFIYIKYLQFIGYKIVFSAHNVIPHFGKMNDRFEKYMRRRILKNFDLTIGHSLNTRDDIKAQLNVVPAKFVTALHGTYDNYKEVIPTDYILPNPGNKRTLYLSSSRNAYKGTADFITLFSQISPEITRSFKLVITGELSMDDTTNLENGRIDYEFIESKTTGNIYLSEEELVTIIRQIDFMVLPYKEITTSGAYFLALTFNKGVITSGLPFFKLHSAAKTVLFYELNNQSSLANVLGQIENGWTACESEIEDLKSKFSWLISAQSISAAYSEILFSPINTAN